MKKIILALVLFSALSAPCFDGNTSAHAAQPSWNPVEQEYYPQDSRKYPVVIENPHPQVRTLAFRGKPLDVFTKLNMVTQIQLPEPPVMINIGNADAYNIDVAPEFASIFVKPLTETDMTNLIVTTERGTYLFMLKENPYKPWDTVVRVGDPYKQVKADDTDTLIQMAVTGRRHEAFQFDPVDMRSPNTTAYVYDPVLKMGSRVLLRRVVALSRANVSVYWIQITNATGDGAKTTELVDYLVSEKSVNTKNLRSVAVPDGGTGLLGKGDTMDMFILVNSGTVPDRFVFRYTCSNSSNVPVEATLKTSGKNPLPTGKSVDERLQELYYQVSEKPYSTEPAGKNQGNQGLSQALPQQKPLLPQKKEPAVQDDGGIVIFGK